MSVKSVPINVLHLEDQPEDVLLCQRSLEAAEVHVRPHRVESRVEFTNALENDPFDLIISDFTLPAFDGLSALEIARDLRPEIPFMFYSGTLGEEAAVEALQQGACDYVLKHRPLRLPAAVRRALRDSEERRHRIQAEQAMRASERLAHRHLNELQSLYREAPVALCYLDTDLYFVNLNEKLAEIGGKPIKDYIGRRLGEMLPDVSEKLEPSCRTVLQAGRPHGTG